MNVAWADSSQAELDQPLVILSSIKPLSLVARALLRDIPEDRVHIVTLLEGNVSPHHHSLRISEAETIQHADILIWIGGSFERFLTKPVARRKKPVLAMSKLDGLLEAGNSSHHDGHRHGQDLHLWLNPDNVILLAEALKKHLNALLPRFNRQLEANLALFRQKTHKTEKAIFAYFDDANPVSYLVFHDAYGHFSRAFNLPDAVALTDVPEQILSAKHLVALRKISTDAACMLVETGNEAKGEAYAKKLNVPMITVDILAYDSAITNYPDLLWSIAERFGLCWE